MGGAEFDQVVKDGKMKMAEAKDHEANLMKLGLKRIDCYINDRRSILWTLERLKKAGQYDEGGAQATLVREL